MQNALSKWQSSHGDDYFLTSVLKHTESSSTLSAITVWFNVLAKKRCCLGLVALSAVLVLDDRKQIILKHTHVNLTVDGL